MYLKHPHFKSSSRERVLVAPQGERKASAASPLKPMLLACPILTELHPAVPMVLMEKCKPITRAHIRGQAH